MTSVFGRVSRWDEAGGYGDVSTEDGRLLFFHCTAIADGSRTISEGTRVVADVVPGHHGHHEARSLRPI